MSQTVVTQLITVAATLGGVVLTLSANAYLERRRARDTHDLEVLRLAAEHQKWLRDERLRSYAEFVFVGEDVLQFIRSELPLLIASYPQHGAETKARWHELSIKLRKTYNRLLFFGTDNARNLARQLWRTTWHGGNDFLRDLETDHPNALRQGEPSEYLNDLVSQLEVTGNRFLDSCREEFHSGPDREPAS